MHTTTIQRICVCGAGTMGRGIAQVATTAGFYTLLYEVNENVLNTAQKSITADLQKNVDKGKISDEQKSKIESHLQYTTDINTCIADLFIEAIIEQAEPKVALFNQLAELNHSDAIFCSNTSSLSITALAEKIVAPQRVAGLHFFNPATLMKLVEVVQGELTDESTIKTLLALIKDLGKTGVVCADSPGFIVNRVARPYYIEALRLAEAGYDLQTIDSLLENAGFKMGPFKLMDLIGNDINYAVSTQVWEQLGRPERLKPSFIQEQKVAGGELGKKSGKGYYQY